LDDGTGVPVDGSSGVHKAGSDPAGSAIPVFDPPASPDPPPPGTEPSSDHSDMESRDPLLTTSFSMSASELQRMPRPWAVPPEGPGLVDVGSDVAISAEGGCEPHGRPGINSLMSSTDDPATLPTLQRTQLSSMNVHTNMTLHN